jgi:hypothetical protein
MRKQWDHLIEIASRLLAAILEQSFRVAVELATPVLMTIVASGALGALPLVGIYTFRKKRR